MENIFFNSWQSIFRTLIVAVIAYFAVIFILRLLGKRTVSQMNAFDFLITVALGSSFAAVALNSNVPLVDGILLIFLLVVMQYSVTWLSVRVKAFKNIVTISPTLLVYKGKIIQEAMRKERITTEELYLTARLKGYATIEDIDAVVLETTGVMTVIGNLPESGENTLSDIKKPFLGSYKDKK